MRTRIGVLLAAGLFLGLAGGTRAQEAVRAVIEKAVKAHGGEANLARLRAGHSKSKGTMDLEGSIPFTREAFYQLPDRMKEIQELEANGSKFTVVSVLNGDKARVDINGAPAPGEAKIAEELKEAMHLLRVTRLVGLLDGNAFVLSPAGEAKVEGRPTVGVKVAYKGYRDVYLYFDKDNGLLLKVGRRALDPRTMQEVAEERVFSGYQAVDGIQTPKKVTLYRDGKKFAEAEVTEVKFQEKLEDSVFAGP
jgi:hypothetical protein